MQAVLLIALVGVVLLAIAALFTDLGQHVSQRTTVQIQPSELVWPWPAEGLLADDSVLLRPVTSETAVAFWASQEDDVNEINGADPAMIQLVSSAILLPNAYQLFAGCAALHLPGSISTLVGGITAALRDDGSIELGIWLTTEHRGNGRGTEALRLAVDHWHSLGYVVLLSTSVGNDAMLRVVEKLGLERVGTEPRVLPNGEEILSANFRRAGVAAS